MTLKIIKWTRTNGKWVSEKTGGGDEITADDLLMTNQPEKKQKIKKIAYFNDDKISDVKLKIAYSLGIPVFRQHLWRVVGGQPMPLSYNINVSGIPVGIDILTNEGDRLFDIPIDPYLFNNREYIKVVANDQFTLLGDTEEINLVDLDEFIAIYRGEIMALEDKYQLNAIYYGFIVKYFPMLSFGAFEEYVAETDISTSYPLLQNTSYELTYLDKQCEIVANTHALLDDEPQRVKRIEGMLKTALTETTLRVDSLYKHKIINFRSLFDLLELDEIIDAVQLYDIYNSKHVLINKYRDEPINEQLIPHVLYIRAVIQPQPRHTLDIYMYINGTYAVRAKFGEDMHMDFDDINKIADKFINPIIRRINAFGRKVMYNGELLECMNKSNVVFTDINISMFWKRAVASSEFTKLRELLSTFAFAKIIQEKEIEKTVLQYYFKRGMFEYDSQRIEKSVVIDNYYQYMSNSDIRQKWALIFDNTRVFTVTQRFNDIKFDITGIKENEYKIYHNYIVYLLSCFMQIRGVATSTDVVGKSLNNLKEQDPKLYKIKAIYNSDVIYSKECQKPFQPKILTQSQYDILDKTEKSKVVKYWNFTSNTDAYYQCPNVKYPHLRFIVGKHPLNYCLPCCKITDPNDGKQSSIFDECLKTHMYNKTTSLFVSNSRYIMNYGKTVDIGRLSNLPASIDTLISEEGVNYYLYGVPQTYEAVNCGLVNCVAHALGLEIPVFVEQMCDAIKKNSQYYNILCGGAVATMFADVREFISDIHAAFTGKPNRFTDFCQLVIDVSHLMNLQLLIFDNANTTIQYRIPDYLNNIVDVQFPDANHIIVLHNRSSGHWNPVYKIQKDVYFRTGIINTRVFLYNTTPVQNIIEMMRVKITEASDNKFDIGVLRKFCDANHYKITKLYVNNNNLCFGVNVANIGYIPVETSFAKPGSDTTYAFTPEIPKYSNIKRFMDSFNKWNLNISEKAGHIRVDVKPSRPQIERVEPIYPLLEPTRTMLYKNKPIAVLAQNILWYCKDAPRANVYNLVCNPLDVNKKLGDVPIRDARISQTPQALYKNNLYQILILHYIRVFNESRNKKVRDSLYALATSAEIRRPGFDIDEALAKIINPGNNNALLADMNKIKIQLLDDLLKGKNKDETRLHIETEHYNFDMMFIEKLKTLQRPQIVAALLDVAKSFTEFRKPEKDAEFPNILTICDGTGGYCKNKKLLIERKTLENYAEILADQIKNNFIEKYLFNPVYQNSLVDYFNFTRRDNEIIEVSFP